MGAHEPTRPLVSCSQGSKAGIGACGYGPAVANNHSVVREGGKTMTMIQGGVAESSAPYKGFSYCRNPLKELLGSPQLPLHDFAMECLDLFAFRSCAASFPFQGSVPNVSIGGSLGSPHHPNVYIYIYIYLSLSLSVCLSLSLYLSS